MGFWFILRGIAKEFFGLSFWDSLARFSLEGYGWQRIVTALTSRLTLQFRAC